MGRRSRGNIRKREAPKEEEIAEQQQVNIGSLYFRNEKEPCLLMLFWLLFSASSLTKRRRRRRKSMGRVRKPPRINRDFIFYLLLFFFEGKTLEGVVECLSETIIERDRLMGNLSSASKAWSEHRKSIEKFLIEMKKSLKEGKEEKEVFMANPTSWLLRSLYRRHPF